MPVLRGKVGGSWVDLSGNGGVAPVVEASRVLARRWSYQVTGTCNSSTPVDIVATAGQSPSFPYTLDPTRLYAFHAALCVLQSAGAATDRLIVELYGGAVLREHRMSFPALGQGYPFTATWLYQPGGTPIELTYKLRIRSFSTGTFSVSVVNAAMPCDFWLEDMGPLNANNAIPGG